MRIFSRRRGEFVPRRSSLRQLRKSSLLAPRENLPPFDSYVPRCSSPPLCILPYRSFSMTPLRSSRVFKWGTWGCPASKFPWTYDSNESCYLLKGKVTVTPSDGRKAVTIARGDFATFPAGMSCTWDVEEAVEKHYTFF
jgi:uncharacterized cupin superfamily protein